MNCTLELSAVELFIELFVTFKAQSLSMVVLQPILDHCHHHTALSPQKKAL